MNLKILQIIDTLRSGGKERQLIEVLKYFSKRTDIKCELILMSDTIHYDYIDSFNIKTYQIIRKHKKDILIFFKFYKLFKEIEPDIIHSWNSMCSVYAVLPSKFLGIKFVNNFLQNVPLKLNINDEAWIRAKLTFPFSDKIAANSYAGLKAYNVPIRKSVCLHNGFDFNRTLGLPTKDLIRKKFDIQAKYVVGMVATFSDKKDYKTFINAAQSIIEYRNDVTFIAVGDGDNLERCKNHIKPESQNRIKFLGKQKNVESIVQIFNIGVLATFTEGISNSIMEYMALEKPVIATDCVGNRELVIEGKTGLLVKVEDHLDMAQKISLLLENKEMAIELGKNGRERITSEFNLEKMGNEFENLYRSLIAI